MTSEEMVALVEELRSQQEDPEGFHTLQEWCEAAGVGTNLMRTRFRTAKKIGRLETTKVLREALDGTQRPVPGYRIAPAD